SPRRAGRGRAGQADGWSAPPEPTGVGHTEGMAGHPPRSTTITSEAAVLARLLPHLTAGDEVEIGPGDDAAVVRLPSPRLVVTTDTLVEGHDFLATTTCPTWIGRKAAVQNLADVVAMGADPHALVVSLSAPADTSAETLEEISRALAERAAAEGASVVGGDLGRAEQLVVTVTALGSLPEDVPAVTRAGARPGDILTIGTERLGRSAAGLALVLGGRVALHDETVVLDGITTPGADALVRHHNAPEADLSLGRGSGRTATAMMDLSDGLVRDGGRIATASSVHLDLDAAALRSDVEQLTALATELGADPWQWVLHGAEEHALLATFSPGAVPAGF